MLWEIFKRGALISSLAGAALIVTGCSKNDSGSAITNETTATTEPAAVDDGGWWCDEHGVPEEECALCDSSLVAKFKADGDWCEEHNRPESQCFLCSPKRFEKFAARYEAKFGAKPPKPEESSMQ
jgi:hypothetical protein